MRKKIMRFAGWFSIGISVLIMLVVLWTGATQLQRVDWRNFFFPALIGLVIYGLSLMLQAWVWIELVAQMTGAKWGWWEVEVYMATHFTRRIPGAPWYMAGRSLMYRQQGRSGQAPLAASLVEWGGMLVTAGIWLTILHFGAWGLLATVLVVGGGIAIWPLFKRGQRLPKRILQFVQLPQKWVLIVCVSYLTSWLFGGFILNLLTQSALPSSTLTFSAVMSLWAISGGVSTLAIIAPAGLGIREVTLTLLLQPYLGPAMSLLVALLFRALFTLGDLIWGGSLWLIAKRRA